MVDYDIITVGGGLGGAALAKAMAERGYRVLVVERETRFKDRVRGEWLAPWGVAEAKALGIYDLLMESCGYHPVLWDTRIGPTSIGERDLAATTPAGCHSMTFYHPQMQEALIAAAEEAGTEVRRDARVRGIEKGEEPRARLEWNGSSEAVSARLIVGVDGRASLVRRWAGFEVKHIQEINQIGGVLLDNVPGPQERCIHVLNPLMQRMAIYFPQGQRRVRVYFANRVDEGLSLQGDKDIPRFTEEMVKTGFDPQFLEGAEAAGPLATFPGVYEWVDRPYKDGVALVGDAACTSDPTWGQGLALTVRGVRELRDALLADDDWERAGNAYAVAHAQFWGALRTVEGWFNQLFFDKGQEADAARVRVFAKMPTDPEMLHDAGFSGPECAPVNEVTRRRFFGED